MRLTSLHGVYMTDTFCCTHNSSGQLDIWMRVQAVNPQAQNSSGQHCLVTSLKFWCGEAEQLSYPHAERNSKFRRSHGQGIATPQEHVIILHAKLQQSGPNTKTRMWEKTRVS